jgi:hypothetical protein
LLDDLTSPEWVFDLKRDSENRVQNLFFAHRKSIELLRANPDVLLMDCTYRTNKYGLPLLHIVGCTNMQSFFSAAFCFLRTEKDLDYWWALSTFLRSTEAPRPRVFISDNEDALKSAARSVFPGVPQLLCVWHINMNVLTHAQLAWRTADGRTKEEKTAIDEKRAVFMKRWDQVAYAKTEADFESEWAQLFKDYASQQDLCAYLAKNKYGTREEWAKAWTSQHRHYDTVTNSPLEGMHKVLKDYLMTSRGDLLRVVERIEHWLQNQYSKYMKDVATAKLSIRFDHQPEKMPFLPSGIHDIITRPAIELVRKQDALRKKYRAEGRATNCTGLFQRTHGLPCHHTIQDALDMGLQLRMHHFDDDHWYYRRKTGASLGMPERQYQFVRDPPTIQRRGRARKDDASTRRDPSAFEQPVPANITLQQELITDVLRSVEPIVQAAAAVPARVPVTTSISASIPASAPVPSTPPTTRLSSPASVVTISISVTSSPRQAPWQPPSLEEFEADIRRRQLQLTLQQRSNPVTLASCLRDTQQEGDTEELLAARNMALATTGIHSEFTPRMAWNFYFGDKRAFHDEFYTLISTSNPVVPSANVSGTIQDPVVPIEASRRPKRAAADRAPAVWAGLSPRKRPRH